MLKIYRSNKAEWLAEILGQELRLNPPEITEEVNIIVSTWPSSRWLSEKLSIINNINALVKYPFPGTYLKRLVKRIIGIDPDEKDPWEKNQLVWNILELSILKENTAKAKSYGLRVNAGHGLTYQNVEPIAAIEGIEELNIGHTIISRALSVGLSQAVKEMKSLIINPRKDNFLI